MPFGFELALDPDLSALERAYIKILGAPVLGLRVRSRAILPMLDHVGAVRRMADAGSGWGVMTFACGRRFPDAEVVGCDLDESLNEKNTRIARQLGLENVHFRTWDMFRLDEFGPFDVVLSSDSLEHVEDDLGCARMFFRALAPGGYLLVHVPHLTRNLFGWHRENWMDIEGHVRPGYTKERLESLLQEAGFQITRCVYNYNSIETLANDISYLITKGRKRNKHLYALALPFLLMIAALGSLYRPREDGSGLVALARRPSDG